MLAVYESLNHYRPYIYGSSCTVFTDHQALVTLKNTENPYPRLAKFQYTLFGETDWKLEYLPGEKNQVADLLSRIPEFEAAEAVENATPNSNERNNAPLLIENVSSPMTAFPCPPPSGPCVNLVSENKEELQRACIEQFSPRIDFPLSSEQLFSHLFPYPSEESMHFNLSNHPFFSSPSFQSYFSHFSNAEGDGVIQSLYAMRFPDNSDYCPHVIREEHRTSQLCHSGQVNNRELELLSSPSAPPNANLNITEIETLPYNPPSSPPPALNMIMTRSKQKALDAEARLGEEDAPSQRENPLAPPLIRSANVQRADFESGENSEEEQSEEEIEEECEVCVKNKDSSPSENISENNVLNDQKTVQRIRDLQNTDAKIQEMKSFILSGGRELPVDEKRARVIPKTRPLHHLKDGVLYHLDPHSKEPRIVVPECLKDEILRAYHDHPMSSHQGVAITYDRLRKRFYWDGLYTDVVKYCEECEECQFAKRGPTPYATPLNPIPVSDVWEKVSIDVCGPFTETPRGNRFIVGMVDNFSKFAIAKAVPSAPASTIAEIFVEDLVLRYGSPKSVQTDRGTNFVGDVMVEICRCFRVQKNVSTSYHPQSQASCEILWKTIKPMLKSLVDEEKSNWDILLPWVIFSYNSGKRCSNRRNIPDLVRPMLYFPPH